MNAASNHFFFVPGELLPLSLVGSPITLCLHSTEKQQAYPAELSNRLRFQNRLWLERAHTAVPPGIANPH